MPFNQFSLGMQLCPGSTCRIWQDSQQQLALSLSSQSCRINTPDTEQFACLCSYRSLNYHSIQCSVLLKAAALLRGRNVTASYSCSISLLHQLLKHYCLPQRKSPIWPFDKFLFRNSSRQCISNLLYMQNNWFARKTFLKFNDYSDRPNHHVHALSKKFWPVKEPCVKWNDCTLTLEMGCQKTHIKWLWGQIWPHGYTFTQNLDQKLSWLFQYYQKLFYRQPRQPNTKSCCNCRSKNLNNAVISDWRMNIEKIISIQYGYSDGCRLIGIFHIN